MTATAAEVKPKRTSGRSRWRPAGNVRRVSKLDRKTRPTDSNNIFSGYRARWGRYTQADPINIFGGLNVYGYVEQNPLGGIDPLALKMAPLAPIDQPGFSVYGNWYGPNWTGGYWKTWNQLTKEDGRYLIPPEYKDVFQSYHDAEAVEGRDIVEPTKLFRLRRVVVATDGKIYDIEESVGSTGSYAVLNRTVLFENASRVGILHLGEI